MKSKFGKSLAELKGMNAKQRESKVRGNRISDTEMCKLEAKLDEDEIIEEPTEPKVQDDTILDIDEDFEVYEQVGIPILDEKFSPIEDWDS